MSNLPDTLFVGPQRCGTTWVHEYLAHHPQVQLPRGTKETFFFDRHFGRGAGWYGAHFPACALAQSGMRRVCEVAPSYFHDIDAPRRIAGLLGRPLIVCTLRDPASRAFSLFLHERRKARVPASFEAALRAAPFIIESSRYASHVRRWQAQFGADRVLVLFQDDLRRDANVYAQMICEYLGLESRPVAPNLERPTNEASVPTSQAVAVLGRTTADLLRRYRLYGVVQAAKRMGLKSLFFGREGGAAVPVMTAEARAAFIEKMLPEIEALESLTGRDLNAWKAV